jgi:hypothetical protein
MRKLQNPICRRDATICATLFAVLLTSANAAPQAFPSPSVLRLAIAEVALAQTKSIDPRWHPDQRDCAGFIRFAYLTAFRQLLPQKVGQGLWVDAQGKNTAFADAQTLIQNNFSLLGRDLETQKLENGDLLAYAQINSGLPVYHLMMVLRTKDPAHGSIHVIYHPGEKGAAVRIGRLEELFDTSAEEWRPTAFNRRFLGYFRYKEWVP